MKNKRDREEVKKQRLTLFRWIDANRYRSIPFQELNEIVNKTTKSQVIIYTLRKLGYLSFIDINDPIKVVKRFDNYDEIYDNIKALEKEHREKMKEKKKITPNTNDSILQEINFKLNQIINHLQIK